jgi:hypothetical protein
LLEADGLWVERGPMSRVKKSALPPRDCTRGPSNARKHTFCLSPEGRGRGHQTGRRQPSRRGLFFGVDETSDPLIEVACWSHVRQHSWQPAVSGLAVAREVLPRFAPDVDIAVLIKKAIVGAFKNGGEDRLFYVDVINLPAALRGAKGTVVINSTVGLSSLTHGTPVKCMGNAIYDIRGLTHQGSLDDFFRNPSPVDRALYKRFRQWLREENQLNGSVWSRLHEDPSRLVR